MTRKPAAADRRPSGLGAGRATLLLALVVLIWGANWPIVKVGLALLPPFWFAAVRIVLAALTLFLLLPLFGRLRLPPRQDLPVVFVVGLLQMTLYISLINVALEVVPAGRSAVLAYTTPLWVAPGAALLLGERLTRRRLAGLALGLAGILVLFNPLDFAWDDRAALGGNALLLGCALIWSIALLAIRGHRWVGSPLDLLPWQLLIGSLCLVPIAYWREGWPEVVWSLELAWIVAFNGPIATAFAFWAVLSLTRSLPALTMSLGSLAVPVAGVAASTLALGEALPPSLLAGMVLVLAGLAAVTLPERGDGR